MTQEQEQRISTAARELSAALNDANTEFDLRVDNSLYGACVAGRSNVYSVEVIHLRPLLAVQA